ncbi:MAG: hypothetical protein ACT4TC_14445 [Myxococcaceae bacterium]
MRWLAFGRLLALLLAFPAGAQERTSKPQVSSDGVYSIRFVEHADKTCDVEVDKEQTKAWSLSKCVGTVDDLYFVSTDGQRFWVLRTLGEKPKTKKSSWHSAIVAVLFTQDGKVVRRKSAAELVPSILRGEVRQMERHFKWLEGAAGVPGKGPRMNDKNQVEFEVVGGKPYKLPF